jgi:hypothetical protein
MIKYTLFLVLLTISLTGSYLPNELIWEKYFGLKNMEENTAITQTSEHDLLLAGFVELIEKGESNQNGLIIKTNDKGELLWKKTIGGPRLEAIYSILETKNKNIITAGTQDCGAKGSYNGWVCCLDKEGTLIWEKAVGRSYLDGISDIIQTKDGNYIFTGYSYSNTKSSQLYIGQINTRGNIIWEKFIGEEKNSIYFPSSIIQANNGELLITGVKKVDRKSIFLMRLDRQGNVIWEKTFGEDTFCSASSIVETTQNNIMVVGNTTTDGAGSFDAWILNLNKDGVLIWEKTFGNQYSNTTTAAVLDKQNNLVVTGTERQNNNRSFGWLFKIDQDGNLLWENQLGKGSNMITALTLTKDNNIAFSGSYINEENGFDFWFGSYQIKSN